MRLAENGNRTSSIVSLESAKMPFYRSTRHRKSGQEVFDLLPAFVAIRMAATLFQLIVDAVLWVATIRQDFLGHSLLFVLYATYFCHSAVIAAISSAIQSASMDFLRINMPIFFNLPNANSSKDTSHAFATFTKVSKLNFMAARSICEGRFHAGSPRQCSLQLLLAFPNFANPFSNYSIIYPHKTPQYLL